MCKQNRDDFFTSGSQCSVSLNPTTKPAQRPGWDFKRKHSWELTAAPPSCEKVAKSIAHANGRQVCKHSWAWRRWNGISLSRRDFVGVLWDTVDEGSWMKNGWTLRSDHGWGVKVWVRSSDELWWSSLGTSFCGWILGWVPGKWWMNVLVWRSTRWMIAWLSLGFRGFLFRI